MSQDVLREVELLIRARYPIVYIVSWEENRVENFLAKVAQKRDKKIYQWSFTTGITPAGLSIQSQKASNASTKDPLIALNEVIERVEPAIYIFKDFHPFLAKNNFAIIRRMKEISINLKDSYKTIVIVSPLLSIPPELEKDITVVDFPLPAVADYDQLLKKIKEDMADNPKVVIEVETEGREKLLQAALGLTLAEAENVFAKILVAKGGKLLSEDVNMVLAEKQQIIRKSGVLEYYESEDGPDNVGGLAELKDWLMKRRLAFSDRAHQFGLPAPRGILLLGVQGCGKSLCAKAVAHLWHLPLLRFDVGTVFGSLVGSSEENMRRAILMAESISPCILWIDEIDKAFAGIRGAVSTDSGTTSRVFGTFLTWLSEKKKPVFVISTANDISQLPPELLRKGRFDEIFFVDLPDSQERSDILKIHLKKRKRDPGKFDLAKLAQEADGFSGAELEEAIVAALYDAFYQSKDIVTDHILRSIKATVPLSKTMEEQLNHLRNWAKTRARNASLVNIGQLEPKKGIELADTMELNKLNHPAPPKDKTGADGQP